MEKISNSIGDLLRLAVAMSGNHEDPSKELNKIREGQIYSIYLDNNWWAQAADRAIDANEKREANGEEYDYLGHIKEIFDNINPIEKENREHLIYDITGVIFADAELTDIEEAFWGLVCKNIDLTEEEIQAQQKIYNENLKKELKELEEKNEFVYAVAYPYWLIISADGEIDDGEVETLNNDSKMLKKYSGPGATMQCEDNFKPELKWDMENDDPEIGKKKYKSRIKASIDIINERLPKNDLKEVVYELNKLILSDNDIHDNESLIFGIICEHIDLTQEEVNTVVGKVTDELKERLSQNSEKTKPEEPPSKEPTKKTASKKEAKSKEKKSTPSSKEGFYRSSDDKVMIGVCAGLANKFNVKKELVRGAVIFGVIVSYGALLPLYLCGLLLKEEPTK